VNKLDIEKYLRMVGHELHEQGLTYDLLLLGGAVMLIEVGNRDSTEDVDTFFLQDFTAITKAAAVVAARESLPDGWLNSAAAGFTHNFIKQPSRNLWKKFPGLHVYTASLDYMLVTKIMASRPKDNVDIVALAKNLQMSKQREVVSLIEEYVPKEHITEAVLDEIEDIFEP
jgi:hypothetical protein